LLNVSLIKSATKNHVNLEDYKLVFRASVNHGKNPPSI